MCRQKPQIVFKTMLWTFQPKREQSRFKHLPFITWPVQDEAIEELVYACRYGSDLVIDKSREMGATWIVLGTFFSEWLLMDDSTFLVTSRKEEYVWKKGNPDTLFWKLEYMLGKLPLWITPHYSLSERHLENKDNHAVIDGESTNADVGAGGRRQAVFCDEFARVNAADAETIQETLSDTTPSRIFGSTPTTRGHPFGKLRFSGQLKVITLGWWRHPWKIQGEYHSPGLDKISIQDITYYRKKYPGVFDAINSNTVFTYSAFERELLGQYPEDQAILELRFIADGNDRSNKQYYSPTGRRSPWYDTQCERRSLRDKATNIDIDYIGAGDTVFNPLTLQRQIEDYGQDPKNSGEITYFIRDKRIVSCKFNPYQGRRRFLWWPDLLGTRPDQTHSYIIGCDTSLGSGQSNSVASIFDCNTNRKVGRWRCPNTSPTAFAEQIVAVAQWVGGATHVPFMIWENNGCGQVFGRRVIEMGYPLIWRTQDEKNVSVKKRKSVGWHNSQETMLNLMVEYDAALEAAFMTNSPLHKFINPDKSALHEAEDYVFFETGGGIGPSTCQSDEGGAKAAHGDCVVADALCHLARKQQPRASVNLAEYGEYNTLAKRRHAAEQMRKRDEGNDVWLTQ
jgi:hypothetical protein